MSDRCEPPEELRGVGGLHWVQWPEGPPQLLRWRYVPKIGAFGWTLSAHSTTAEGATNASWRYLAPVATPAEVAALRAERDAARAQAAITRGEQILIEKAIAILRARVDRLEAALWDAVEGLGGVLAWHITPAEYQKHGFRAEDAELAWAEARSALKTARAALDDKQ